MKLETLRKSLDDIDFQINILLAERFSICLQIGIEKKKGNIPIVNESIKLSRKSKYIEILGVYGDAIYEVIHEQSVKIQNEV